jgi:hypothetical protein
VIVDNVLAIRKGLTGETKSKAASVYQANLAADVANVLRTSNN